MSSAREGAARHGFTLIEMLGVLLLMGLILGVAIDFMIDLNRASQEAIERNRGARRAMLLIDRVARDLEAAMLVRKPDALDPLAHPWLFLAEGGADEDGASRLKFTTRSHRPRSPEAAESDLAMVAWMLERSEADDFELRRWSWPHLPDGLDRSFPPVEASEAVASGIAAFAVRFLGEDGEWVTSWDSSMLVQSSQLPLAAEIEVAFYADDESDAIDGPYQRRVLLPLRPIDIEAQVARATGQDGIPPGQEDAAADGEAAEQAAGDDTQCTTVGQCLARNPGLTQGIPPELRDLVQGSMGRCARDFAAVVAVPANCLP